MEKCGELSRSVFVFQLSVRGKNKKEKLGGFFKSITKTADEVLLSSHKVGLQMSYIVRKGTLALCSLFLQMCLCSHSKELQM